MHRFHEILHRYENIKTELEASFNQTKEIFERVPEFQQFSEALRSDFSTALKCWSYKLHIDFEAYNPLNFFHALRVQAKEEDQTRAFEELGTGEQQVLAISRMRRPSRAGLFWQLKNPKHTSIRWLKAGWQNA